MNHFFLGVDAGASRTRAVLADGSGCCRGFGKAGPGNPRNVGHTRMTEAITSASRAALAMAGVPAARVAAIGLGVAGYNWPSELSDLMRVLPDIGGGAPKRIVNDTLLGLLAGAEEGWGVALAAGTHCNCRGWDRERREGRVVGLGVGEAAGGTELVARAVRAVAAEWTRRGPPTLLTGLFAELTGASGAEDLLEGLTTGRLCLSAQAAPLVFEAAAAGDAVAGEVIVWAGRELASLTRGVIAQLKLQTSAFDVVLFGGLFQDGQLLYDAVAEGIASSAPRARLIHLEAPPAVGGVLLAMERIGLDHLPLRERLLASCRDLCLRGGGENEDGISR